MPKARTFIMIGVLLAGLLGIVSAMTLIRPDEDASAASETTQTAEVPATTALTVEVVTPELASWPVEVHASGWLAAWREAVISAEVGGQRIEEVNVDVGDTVKKGDLLASLSRKTLENDIEQLEASLDSAKAQLEQASADADRARRLEGGGSISQQQISEYLIAERKAKSDVASAEAALSSARLDLDRTRIVAVSDGVISEANAAIGDVVTAGAELFRMIRDGRVEWQAEVPLNKLRQIEVGTQVRIPTPIGAIQGRVRQVAPSVSETNGRVIVYVALDQPKEGPQPKTGIMVSGVFVTGEREALSVPSSAVVLQDGFSYVFVLNEGAPTTVNRRRVETGRRQDDRVEIMSDLPVDADVVRSGGAFLSDGTRVRVAPEEATGVATDKEAGQ
ncbi:efflux RND transporter periplasmic adaptor subunit [Rhodobacter sp. NSM]|uniref:efflux RND transporter periplasmic adaptor subunit n=1 Tax=Rhodobacter sp. NSM TaxID=3457501 RepID=UPI003FD41C4E